MLKRLTFLHCAFLPPLSKIDCRCTGLFLNSVVCSIDQYVCAPIQCCFDNLSFVGLSDVCKGYASSFVLFPWDCFGNSESFLVPYKFQDFLFWFCGKRHGYFDRDYIKSVDCFGYYSHLKNIDSSNPRACVTFLFLCIIFSILYKCFIVSIV